MFADFPTVRGFVLFVIFSMTSSFIATGQDVAPRANVSAKKDGDKNLRWGDPGAVVVGFNIIKVPAVQKELNLTAKQKEQVAKAYEQQQARLTRTFQEREQARSRDGQRVAGPISIDTRPTEKAVMEILSPEQRQRFQQLQLQLQRSGIQAFRREETARILNLSDEQRAFIQSVFNELNFEQEELSKAKVLRIERVQDELRAASMEEYQAVHGKAPKPQLDQIRKRIESIQEGLLKYDEKDRQMNRELEQKAKKAIGGVLTRKQRENFDKTTGKPFDFTRMGLVNEPPEPETKAATASAKSE